MTASSLSPTFFAWSITCGIVTAKTFCGNKTAKAVLPLRCRLICQGFQPLSMSSDPLVEHKCEREGG